MIGVIAGDVIGSVHEHALRKSTDFPLFNPRCRSTDDTVLLPRFSTAERFGYNLHRSVKQIRPDYQDAIAGGIDAFQQAFPLERSHSEG